MNVRKDHFDLLDKEEDFVEEFWKLYPDLDTIDCVSYLILGFVIFNVLILSTIYFLSISEIFNNLEIMFNIFLITNTFMMIGLIPFRFYLVKYLIPRKQQIYFKYRKDLIKKLEEEESKSIE